MDGFKKKPYQVTSQETALVNVVDISNPQIMITENVWVKEPLISWWGHYWWEIKNTGNVTLTDVDVAIAYYDIGGVLIDGFVFSGNYLAVNQSTGWDDWLTNLGATQPFSAFMVWQINAYDPTYQNIYATVTKTETKYRPKNKTQGYIGLLTGVVGVSMVISYLLESRPVAKFTKKYDLDFRVMNNKGGPQILISKRL